MHIHTIAHMYIIFSPNNHLHVSHFFIYIIICFSHELGFLRNFAYSPCTHGFSMTSSHLQKNGEYVHSIPTTTSTVTLTDIKKLWKVNKQYDSNQYIIIHPHISLHIYTVFIQFIFTHLCDIIHGSS